MTTKYKCLYDITGKIEDVNTFLVPLQDLPKQEHSEPCPDKDHTEYACKNRHQCFEPCGELGHSEEFVQVYQQEQDEPVAVVTPMSKYADASNCLDVSLPVGTKLYTTPQQRKPLTFQDIAHLWMHTNEYYKFARAIEAAHGIKG